jgi:nitrogen fixation/metabolism regulation signal transduction histidine kinase
MSNIMVHVVLVINAKKIVGLTKLIAHKNTRMIRKHKECFFRKQLSEKYVFFLIFPGTFPSFVKVCS